MRSLYWKIFLWFWAAMILMAVAVSWSTVRYMEMTRPDPAPLSGQGRAGAMVARLAGRLESLDDAALRRAVERVRRRAGVEVYVLDARDRDLLGRSLPEPVAAYLEEPAGSGVATGRAGALIVRPYVTASGETRRLVADLSEAAARGPPPHRRGAVGGLARLWRRAPPGLAEVRWLRIGVAVLVSGLVCYLLARYLTAPIRSLRAATQRLSAGDLGARVAPSMGRRRDEIGDLGRDFDTMATRLETLVEGNKRLLRDVSHELRSPLARLQVALGLARKRSEGRAGAELHRIEREAERLDELIGQVLTLAQLDRGLAPESLAPVEVDALLREVVADARFESQATGREVRIVESAPVTLTGDPGRLHAAVENVVRNAVRYTAEGGAVEVSLAPRAGGCAITVRDHGPGVDEAALEHLFEPFYRADDARDRGSGGHGLGLAIAERAVRLHGGRIAARNAPGGGLEVTIELPAGNARTLSPLAGSGPG